MKKAFTRIELLAAILFPVLAQAKVAAKTSACLSNSKPIGLGTMPYVTDVWGLSPFHPGGRLVRRGLVLSSFLVGCSSAKDEGSPAPLGRPEDHYGHSRSTSPTSPPSRS